MITNIILTVVIFWTFLWTWVNFSRILMKSGIPGLNNLFMSIGWTAIIIHIIGIW